MGGGVGLPVSWGGAEVRQGSLLPEGAGRASKETSTPAALVGGRGCDVSSRREKEEVACRYAIGDVEGGGAFWAVEMGQRGRVWEVGRREGGRRSARCPQGHSVETTHNVGGWWAAEGGRRRSSGSRRGLLGRVGREVLASRGLVVVVVASGSMRSMSINLKKRGKGEKVAAEGMGLAYWEGRRPSRN